MPDFSFGETRWLVHIGDLWMIGYWNGLCCWTVTWERGICVKYTSSGCEWPRDPIELLLLGALELCGCIVHTHSPGQGHVFGVYSWCSMSAGCIHGRRLMFTLWKESPYTSPNRQIFYRHRYLWERAIGFSHDSEFSLSAIHVTFFWLCNIIIIGSICQNFICLFSENSFYELVLHQGL